MNKVRLPGFTASASLRPTMGNHRTTSDGLAAREAIVPQMEIPDPSDTRDQPPIHFHPPPQDDRPPWWLGDNRPPWVGGSAGSGGGGGGWGSGNSKFNDCVDDCKFWYRAEKRDCGVLLDSDAQEECRVKAKTKFVQCVEECARNRPSFPWPW